MKQELEVRDPVSTPRTFAEKVEVVLLKWVAKKLGISKEYETLKRKLGTIPPPRR